MAAEVTTDWAQKQLQHYETDAELRQLANESARQFAKGNRGKRLSDIKS